MRKEISLTERKNKFRSQSLIGIATLCIFAKSYLGQLIPGSFEDVLYLIGVAMLLWYGVSRYKRAALTGLNTLVWVLFAAVVTANVLLIGVNNWGYRITMLSILGLVVLSLDISWFDTAYAVLIGILLIFAISTILLFVFPELYTPYVKIPFFPTDKDATGYQSGLTSHYSKNGFYIALGFVLTTSKLLFLNKKKHNGNILLALSIVFAIALLLTSKRGMLLSAYLGLALAYLASQSKGKMPKVIAVSALIALVLIVGISFVPELGTTFERFLSMGEGSSLEESTSGRTYLWEAALADWRTSPLFGIGWGNYYYIWYSGESTAYAHNECLHQLATIGIVGFAIFAVCALSALFTTLKVARNAKRNSHQYMILMISLSVQLYVLIYGFSSGGILNPSFVALPYILSISVPISISATASLRVQRVDC